MGGGQEEDAAHSCLELRHLSGEEEGLGKGVSTSDLPEQQGDGLVQIFLITRPPMEWPTMMMGRCGAWSVILGNHSTA